ncbi:protein of unknown function [Candidatus Methylomirabilis oxygeniifera]|uniref:Uncharacterized protein n=1 Tax=Methylomirabilis oxygeniifera TaxID=671143 RepID=D5MHG9_METO1|nr:protein of unknown function [Candidatus Methylomirabilis oxyfera]
MKGRTHSFCPTVVDFNGEYPSVDMTILLLEKDTTNTLYCYYPPHTKDVKKKAKHRIRDRNLL